MPTPSINMVTISALVRNFARVEKIPSLATAPRQIQFDIVDNNFWYCRHPWAAGNVCCSNRLEYADKSLREERLTLRDLDFAEGQIVANESSKNGYGTQNGFVSF